MDRRFLDEIRARVGLAATIQRRTRLVKKGREWTGLCPFHNEKSPSFTVNEDKGFFHCFGCGAHGDVIGFVMQAENLGFVEAIERLAAEAGLEVPKPTPEARARAARDATLHDVMEAACLFFQSQLRSGGGASALSYLERRGLDAAAIERFRLGYAPAGQGLLKQHLLREFPEALLEAAGLTARREGSDATFDYFRDRVMFPILDRGGRVIAFGGRVLGDAKPKYLNSPETPVFHKGGVLYGLSWAREGVRQGAPIVVTEGYMDVIALHRAGFAGAVAPLGTALTEDQLGELWRLAPEPVLCFDGDAAGQRAAARAVERALPLLRSGRSLQFAVLPQGEDPDTLLVRFGPVRMREVLAQARPLAEFLWSIELATKPVNTPERRADLSSRLMARAGQIADDTLQREYRSFFRTCLFERIGRSRRGDRRARPGTPEIPPPGLPPTRRHREEQFVLVLLKHPHLLDQLVEEFATTPIEAADLDRLRREIVNAYVLTPGLDADTLRHHLCSAGLAEAVDTLTAPRVLELARTLSDDRDRLVASWRQLHGFLRDGLSAGLEQEALAMQAAQDLGELVARVKAMQAEWRGMVEAEPDSADVGGRL
ncbi:MAG TPA: DNA primase [Stellaceae bacterium]|nr:DNA primase [Stellaceae bacterium]